jgi:hypothetical protein
MQPNLFDAQTAADEAIENATGGADARFIGCALVAVEQVAREKESFTTEDVKPLCEMTPSEPRAWGGVMRIARDRGWVENTYQSAPSGKKSNHNRPQTIWRSLIRAG